MLAQCRVCRFWFNSVISVSRASWFHFAVYLVGGEVILVRWHSLMEASCGVICLSASRISAVSRGYRIWGYVTLRTLRMRPPRIYENPHVGAIAFYVHAAENRARPSEPENKPMGAGSVFSYCDLFLFSVLFIN